MTMGLTAKDIAIRVERTFGGLGQSVDQYIEPQEIEDPELRELWTKAQVVLNEIQMYLEEHVPEYKLETP
jgi:hypothetical protein